MTLFAPSNAAFGELFTKLNITPEALLNDTALLTSVLTYHVLPGGVFAADDFVTKTYNTMNDEKVRVRGSMHVCMTDVQCGPLCWFITAC